jgi:amidase
MNRRELLKVAAMSGATALVNPLIGNVDAASAAAIGARVAETSIADLQAAMEAGRETAVSVTLQYLERISAIDRAGPSLHSVIEVNPDAESIARALDEERKSKGPRGPMHGVPVLVKDNLDTHDRMQTTAGSLALVGPPAPRDSYVVEKLRTAGAVILGKANLSEWANIRSNHSTSGWSARGGLTKNPYALDRNPSGSSSGSAVAVSAGLCAVAVGTETNGSILSPSTVCGIVGLKPTVGLVSRAGIIPISHTQDTAGPMARSVRDAAILLGAMAGEDARDAATKESGGKAHADYTKFLDKDGLKGARIGVLRGELPRQRDALAVVEAALRTLKDAGAVLVDPVALPSMEKIGDAEITVLLYELKADLNAYLETRGSDAPVRTLAEVIAFNEKHADTEMPYFRQELFLEAEKKGPLTDKAYLDALAKCRRLSRDEGIDAVMTEHKLDAVFAPSGGPAGATDLIYGDRDFGGSSSPAAVAGYPNVTVPAGAVHGLPLGISFFGRAYTEPVLLRLAYAFEQATRARLAPRFLPTLG